MRAAEPTRVEATADRAAEGPIPVSILLVDDYPSNLLSISAILEPLGHRIVTARSGEEALRHVLLEEFAVILLDVQMPGMDGLETAQLIRERERSRHVPILFLTAISRDAPQILKGYQQGAVDYLLKPFDPEILCAKVSVFSELYRRGVRIQLQQEALRRRERDTLERRNDLRFRRLTDALPACVWSLHRDGRVRYCNRHFEDYVGTRATALTRFDELGSCHPDDRERLRDWSVALRGGAGDDLEIRVLRAADEAYRWHLLRAVGETGDGDEILGWTVTGTDIEDRKRDEIRREALLVREQRARADAEDANRTKDVFLATVSHELRTPLSAILGWTQILQRGLVEPDAVRKALDTIERNTRAQMRLTEDILDVTRATMGKLQIAPRTTDLIDLIVAAAESLRPVADAKGITIELPASRRRVEALVDTARIQQVVGNLLSNAIKFTPRGGVVRLEALEEDGVAIRVTDNGRGIDPAFLPFLFDRFRQADATNTRAHGGLGLGLAIVRHIVDLHGGTVDASSGGIGTGATFTVRLPSSPGRTPS